MKKEALIIEELKKALTDTNIRVNQLEETLNRLEDTLKIYELN